MTGKEKKPNYSDDKPIDDTTEEQKEAQRRKTIERKPAHAYELLNASERALEELEKLAAQGGNVDLTRLDDLRKAVSRERRRLGRDKR